MTQPAADVIRDHLAFLYGPERANELTTDLLTRLDAFRVAHSELQRPIPPEDRLTEDDVILITYGDQVSEPGKAPLQTLAEVLNTTLANVVSGVHILPFYPYTSDDGFSVVDYRIVDPQLGTWEDTAPLRQHYRLMFDAVVNHISASSEWFQAFLRGEPGAEERFIIEDPATDLSLVTRPRTHPLLTRFETANGPRYVWTTFSTDQIDLNFKNPDVLLDMIDVLLLYVHYGASLIRLDAIGYLWKQVGTRSIHLEQTHRAVQLFRAALDHAAPNVLLITETNVPHADNISYFGNGSNEAQMVYQFPLAPLVLNAFHRGSAHHLTTWAAGLDAPSGQTTFFNFLASHDGIGVVPATGILGADEVAQLVDRTIAHGGRVSYKNNSDGSQSPYELNITLFDVLSNPQDADDPYAVDRFITANAIMMALQGVPGVYVHSLVGSHNNHAGLEQTGRARTINREKWQRAALEQRLGNVSSHERQVLNRMSSLIQARRGERAFHPNSSQQVLSVGVGLFALIRARADGSSRVLCVHNVSGQVQHLALETTALGFDPHAPLHALLGEGHVQHNGRIELSIAPYQTLWLKG